MSEEPKSSSWSSVVGCLGLRTMMLAHSASVVSVGFFRRDQGDHFLAGHSALRSALSFYTNRSACWLRCTTYRRCTRINHPPSERNSYVPARHDSNFSKPTSLTALHCRRVSRVTLATMLSVPLGTKKRGRVLGLCVGGKQIPCSRRWSSESVQDACRTGRSGPTRFFQTLIHRKALSLAPRRNSAPVESSVRRERLSPCGTSRVRAGA